MLRYGGENMKRPGRLLVLAMLIAVLAPLDLRPCTTFCFKANGEWIFGRNYDFSTEAGLVMVNKRGVAKTALLPPGTASRPAAWVSKYGSVTFNQFGRELPLGGMNEAGLVLELMWLTPTEYPNVDARPSLRELQWVQYQLDTAATVQDVISSDKAVRIEVNEGTPVHFLACDRKGGAAVIEFLGGRMRAYSAESLPVPALTNSTYEYCLDFLRISGSDETAPPFVQADNSRRRFVYAANGIRAWEAKRTATPSATLSGSWTSATSPTASSASSTTSRPGSSASGRRRRPRSARSISGSSISPAAPRSKSWICGPTSRATSPAGSRITLGKPTTSSSRKRSRKRAS